MHISRAKLALLTTVLTSLFLPASAQEFRASLAGRVTDPSGAAVSGATVTAVSNATKAPSQTTTNPEGFYQILFLQPGEYTVSAEQQGFQKKVQSGLNLQVAERATLDIQLAVGDVTQTINVEASATVIETESADRSLTVDTRRMEATPLQGRNVMALAWTSPGVTVTASVTRLRPFDIAGSSSISINGGRPSMNELLVDGVTALGRANSVTFIPQSETTDEMRVQTTTYDAQYGGTTGGVINITTKSGSNQWHGSLFEYLQNTVLNANTFNNNRNGVRRQSSNINTFGGTVGGAVVKNKLFFFFGHEQIRQVIPDPFNTSVATAPQRNGDFSQTFFDAGRLQTIFDPLTTEAVTGGFQRQPFAGNVIPTSRINPVAAAVLRLIPQGNVAGNAVTGLNNLANNSSTRKFVDIYPEYHGRGDWVISEKSRFFIRYSRNALQETRGYRYSTIDTINVADTSSNSPFTRDNHHATVQFTHTFNASTVLDLRAGFARFQSKGGFSPGANFDLASIGFSSLYKSQALNNFPRFTFDGYEGAGASVASTDPISQTVSGQAAIFKTIGRHTIKTGGEWRLIRNNSQQPGDAAGNFRFTQLFTGANPLAVASSSGNSIASFLLGTVQEGWIDVNTQPARQMPAFAYYVNDDFRVTERLKLTLGLRWDYRGGITERFNALLRGFDTTSASPLQVPGLNVLGGLSYAGAGSNPRNAYDSDSNNFAPRFGVAYKLSEKTSLRGGYGLIYAQQFDEPAIAPGFNQRTSMVTSVVPGRPENFIVNPFPGGILRPVGNSLGLAANLGQGFSYGVIGNKLPYTHQYSLEIQRELPGRFLFTAGYVGNRVNGLQVSQQVNEVSAANLAQGAAFLNTAVANPFAGRVPGTALNAANIARSQLLRPFPQFLAIQEQFRPVGKSFYNGFQAMIVKRMSKGVSMSASYTFSKNIEAVSYRNAQDSTPERVIAAWDIPHNLQLNAVYELPFGAGRQFLNSSPGVVKGIVGGWEISGIARIQSGMPIALPGNPNTVPTGASMVASNQSLDRWFNNCTILANGTRSRCASDSEVAAWTVRPAATLQTWSSRFTEVRQPGIYNLDLALIKRTRVAERVDFIFRAEAMNATNTPQWFNRVNTDVNNGNFGRIVGTGDQTNLPRFFQLSLQMRF